MSARLQHLFATLLLGAGLSACSAAANVAVQPGADSKVPGTASNMLAPASPQEVCSVYFGSYDANQDGYATLEEYAAVKMIPAGYDPDPQPPIVENHGDTSSATIVPPTQASLEASFKVLDADHDGKLTKAELCAAIVAKTPSAPPAQAAATGAVAM